MNSRRLDCIESLLAIFFVVSMAFMFCLAFDRYKLQQQLQFTEQFMVNCLNGKSMLVGGERGQAVICIKI